MTEVSLRQDSSGDAPLAGDSPCELEQLRDLIMGEEYDDIVELFSRFSDSLERSKWIAEVIAESVRHSTERDQDLGIALAPTIDQAFRSSVESDPQPLVDALFPIIGPAIRRSVTELVGAILEKVNTTIDHSLSPRSVRWRFESMRTGIPFSEIVLRETIAFRVEQVFLVHRETGLLLAHATADEEFQDPDLVSSMLMAIRQFMTDSFGATEGDVTSMDVGDLTLVVEPGPRAVVAALIRGTPSREVQTSLRELVEDLHRKHDAQMQAFEGDAACFAVTLPQLEACLVERAIDEEDESEIDAESGRPWIWKSIVALALVAMVGLGFLRWDRARTFDGVVAALRTMPGVVLIDAERRGAHIDLQMLRDPDARDPLRVARQSVGEKKMTLALSETAYLSLEPDLLMRRARRTIAPPIGVDLEFDGERIALQGRADARWIHRARELAQPLGATGLDWSSLQPDFSSLVEPVEAQVIAFDSGVSEPQSEQDYDLDRIARAVHELTETANALAIPVQIHVTGRADTSGNDEINRSLALTRGRSVHAALIERGVDPRQLSITQESDDENPHRWTSIPRRVDFSVRLGAQDTPERRP